MDRMPMAVKPKESDPQAIRNTYKDCLYYTVSYHTGAP
jgi:hypothetical protein